MWSTKTNKLADFRAYETKGTKKFNNDSIKPMMLVLLSTIRCEHISFSFEEFFISSLILYFSRGLSTSVSMVQPKSLMLV
jgi:hypothetical protein